MQPSRRTVLGTVAAGLVGTAGCLGGDPTGGSTAEPSETTRSTAGTAANTTRTAAGFGAEQPAGGVSVGVSNLAVQDSVLYLDSPDSMAVATPDDADDRYVLVDVSGSESGPPPEAFSLVVDGETYAGRVDITGYGDDIDGRGVKYDPSYGTDSGWVAFVVPAPIDAANGRISLDYGGETATWTLAENHVNALGRPKAQFELRDVSIPETVTVNERVSVRVTAENVSDVEGIFRGVLNVANLEYAYAPYPFESPARPGETVGWEKTFDETPPENAPSIGFVLDTVAGGREVWAPVQVGTAVGTATASTDG